MSQLEVTILTPTLEHPGDRVCAEATGIYRVTVYDGRIDLELTKLEVWINGKLSNVDLPGCYAVHMERAAYRAAREEMYEMGGTR